MFLLWLYFSHFSLDRNVNVSIVKRCPGRRFFWLRFSSEAISFSAKTSFFFSICDTGSTHRDTEYLVSNKNIIMS